MVESHTVGSRLQAKTSRLPGSRREDSYYTFTAQAALKYKIRRNQFLYLAHKLHLQRRFRAPQTLETPVAHHSAYKHHPQYSGQLLIPIKYLNTFLLEGR